MKTFFFETIDSSNTYIKNNYQTLDDLTFVSTNIQTQGKGRLSRKWEAEDNKNLLFSLLIKDTDLINKYKSLSILTAYSIIKVLEKYNLNNLKIKWPNDIYVNDKKICGILLESVSKENIECLIIGVGLNVNQETFNGEYIISPTSLINELNVYINIDTLKTQIYETLIENINKLKQNYNFYNEIKEYDYLKDKEAYALINNEKTKIKVLGIKEDYSLRINNNDQIIDIDSGEISFHV